MREDQFPEPPMSTTFQEQHHHSGANEQPPSDHLPPIEYIQFNPRLRELSLYFYYLRERDMIPILAALPTTAPSLHTLKLLNLYNHLDLSPIGELLNLRHLVLSFKMHLTAPMAAPFHPPTTESLQAIPDRGHDADADADPFPIYLDPISAAAAAPTVMNGVIIPPLVSHPPLATTSNNLFAPLAQLNKLETLSLNNGAFSESMLTLLPSLPSRLQFFDLHSTFVTGSYLRVLHARFPNLTRLEAGWFDRMAIAGMEMFRNLTSLSYAPCEDVTDIDYMQYLTSIPSLTHIDFDDIAPQESEPWRILFDGLSPSLTSLTLGSSCPRSLATLMSIPSVARSLRRIQFRACQLANGEFEYFVANQPLAHLQACTIHVDAFPDVKPQYQCDVFNSVQVFPSLSYLYLESIHPSSTSWVRVFIWDRPNGINVNRFRLG